MRALIVSEIKFQDPTSIGSELKKMKATFTCIVSIMDIIMDITTITIDEISNLS